jgi:hypothetical protein
VLEYVYADTEDPDVKAFVGVSHVMTADGEEAIDFLHSEVARHAATLVSVGQTPEQYRGTVTDQETQAARASLVNALHAARNMGEVQPTFDAPQASELSHHVSDQLFDEIGTPENEPGRDQRIERAASALDMIQGDKEAAVRFITADARRQRLRAVGTYDMTGVARLLIMHYGMDPLDAMHHLT